MSDPVITRLPVRDNIKRRIRKLRQKGQIAKAPNDLNIANVPHELSQTTRKNQFLRCDTGPGMI